jgi:hypothetical protein
MPEIVAEGMPFESSPEAAANIYASTPPSFSSGFGALFNQESTIGRLQRGSERGQYAGSSWFDRYLAVTGQAQEGIAVPGQQSRVAPPIETPELSSEEANKRYAPPGTTITNAPMREGIAALVGKAKQDEIDREQVIQRFEQAHSWPVNFLSGMAAFTLDPLNASTMIVPGFGEEAVAGVLGRGLLARTAGRVVSGATGGAAAQVPLSAIKLGLGSEEASDYNSRDFLQDVFYSAAGGAVIHAGIGAVRDYVRPPVEAAPRPEAPPPSEKLPEAPPPQVNWAAMRSAISQTMDGRPTDVMPVIDAEAVRLASREADLRNQADQLGYQLLAMPKRPEEVAASETLARLETVERNLRAEDTSAAERRELVRRRDELLSNTTPEQLRQTVAPVGMRRNLENQKRAIEQEIANVTAERQSRVPILGTSGELAGINLSNLGDAQRQVYRNGFAQGVPQAEFNAANEEVYGTKAPEETEAPESTPATRLEESEQPATSKEAAAPTAPKPSTPEEKDAADLEAQWNRVNQAQPAALTADQLEEIRSAVDEYNKAQQTGLGYDQAAICLNGSGV